MSDISIFSDNDIFVMYLVLFAPLVLFLLLGYFFKSLKKPRAAKILYGLAIIYTLIISIAILFLTLS